MTFAIRPRYVAADHRMELGFGYAEVSRRVSARRAAAPAVSGLWTATKETVSAVIRILEPRERQQLHGVIGSYRATQESFATSTSLAFEAWR